MDESGYAFVGKLLLSGGEWPTKSYIFSSDFPLYLLGIADQVYAGYGGRLMSALLGGGSLYLSYCLFRHYDTPPSLALYGTGLLSIQPSHIAISKMATYDSLCFFLFCAGILYFSLALTNRRTTYIFFSAVLMCLATLSKYIAIAYLPIFALIALINNKRIGLYFILFCSLILSLYVAINWKGLHLLYNHQLRGVHDHNSSSINIFKFILIQTWPILISFVLLSPLKKLLFKDKTILLLIFLSCPLLAYHILFQNEISLYKHIVHFLFFNICIIVYFLKKSNIQTLAYSSFIITFTALISAYNSHKILSEFNIAWPNTTIMEDNIHSLENPIILSEDPYLFRNYLYGKVSIKNLYDTNWFDPYNTGKHDELLLIESIKKQKFDYIYLNMQVTPTLSKKIIKYEIEDKYKVVHFEKPLISKLINSNNTPILALYRKTEKNHE